jgi:ABC-2 type transport system ATP-binding protein
VITLAPEETAEFTPTRLDMPGATITTQDDARLTVQFDPDKVAVADLIQAVLAQRAVSDISIVEPDLEGVVRQITENGHLLS